MNFFKRSLLVSTSLLCGMHSTWAMEDNSQEETDAYKRKSVCDLRALYEARPRSEDKARSFEKEKKEGIPRRKKDILAPTLQPGKYDTKNEVYIMPLTSGSTTYTRDEFSSGEVDGDLFTFPNIPPAHGPIEFSFQSQEKHETVPHVNEPKFESLLKKGIDNRIRIQETTKWPNSIHAQLNSNFCEEIDGALESGNRGGGVHGGSGIAVGPQHILTAAHNVYLNGVWARDISVRLGLNGKKDSPWAVARVTRAYVLNEWVASNGQAVKYDLALLILDYPFGYRTGWAGLLSKKNLKGIPVNVTGYPGDHNFNKMMTMKANELKEIQSQRFSYDADTFGGQSGGGVTIDLWGAPYAVGVHTLGQLDGTQTGNSGVRLVADKFKKLVRWISETHILQRTSSLPPRSEGSNVNHSSASNFGDEGLGGIKLSKGQLSVKSVEAQCTLTINFAQLIPPDTLLKLLPGLAVLSPTTGNISPRGEEGAVGYHLRNPMHPENKKYSNRVESLQLVTSMKGLASQPSKVEIGYSYGGDQGIPQNGNRSIELLEAVRLGDPDAKYKLGVKYHEGKDVKKDDKKAVSLFEEAALNGHSAALYHLGLAYYNGDGVRKDLGIALACFQQAGEKGDAWAQYCSGMAHKLGEGTEKNNEEAKKWLRKAAEQGHVAAGYSLKELK